MFDSFKAIQELVIYLDSGFGLFLYAIIYILIVIFLLPASWLSLIAGFLYGPYKGSLIVFISAFLGATISFFLAKELFSTKVNKLISKFSKFHLLEKVIQKGGLKLIIFTRLSPIFPFSILNYFYGLNKINYKDFSIGLFFILPGTFLYCSLGGLANNLNEIKNLKLDNNIITTLVSIISTSIVIYLLTKYANEVINENTKN